MEQTQQAIPPAPKPKFDLNQFKSKLITRMKEIWAKFYAKKTIFWPVTIVFALLFLTILLGLIFGNGKTPMGDILTRPTPTPLPKEETKESGLTKTETDLKELRLRIDNLDVKQGRLRYPTLNFDVKF